MILWLAIFYRKERAASLRRWVQLNHSFFPFKDSGSSCSSTVNFTTWEAIFSGPGLHVEKWCEWRLKGDNKFGALYVCFITESWSMQHDSLKWTRSVLIQFCDHCDFTSMIIFFFLLKYFLCYLLQGGWGTQRRRQHWVMNFFCHLFFTYLHIISLIISLYVGFQPV